MVMDFLTKILDSWPFLLILFAITSVGSYGFYKHAAKHTDGSDDIQTAGEAQKGLMSSTHHSDLETAKSDIITIDTDLAVVESEIEAAKGSRVSVDTRLSVCLADSGGVSQGTSFPEDPAPIEGQLFYRTDEDKVYIYNGASWDELAGGAPSDPRFCIQGTAQVSIKVIQALSGRAATIAKVKVYADTAPTGASLIVDVNKNGTTIFTTQANRPTLAIGQNSDDSGTPDVTSIAEGDRWSIDIDQVGSTEPGGNDLLVTIVLE